MILLQAQVDNLDKKSSEIISRRAGLKYICL